MQNYSGEQLTRTSKFLKLHTMKNLFVKYQANNSMCTCCCCMSTNMEMDR
jgi:hypothetical protein